MEGHACATAEESEEHDPRDDSELGGRFGRDPLIGADEAGANDHDAHDKNEHVQDADARVEVRLETTRVFGRLESSITDLARFVQDHPDQVLYALLGLLGLWVVNELRHLPEKRTLCQALRHPEVTPPVLPVSPAPAPQKRGNGVGGLILIPVVIAGLLYALPLLQGQRGQALAAPVPQVFTTGTYRGMGTGDLSSTTLTLTLELVGRTKRVQLESAVGTFDFEGQITPESGATYLSGTLVDRNGMLWGTLQAHVTTTRVTGMAGAGSLQWPLDLCRSSRTDKDAGPG